jgi:uncharacterized protein (DUF2141 family)
LYGQLHKHAKFAVQLFLMKISGYLYFVLITATLYIMAITGSGCAQIGSITGGDKDSLAPVLINSDPKSPAINITSKKITLSFDEYVEAQEVQTNLIVSPYPKNSPEVTVKLKTISIKLKDSLLPNTTYSLNFGNAIRDVNESNILKGFTYVFSTGNTIDSLTFSGKVLLAESGQADSTLLVMLYRNTNDSAVQKLKPTYITTVNGDGSFIFNNLPSGNFNAYALKDGDGSKNYNSKTELFAFLDKPITINDSITPVSLYAYAAEKKDKASTPAKPKTTGQKRLTYTAEAVKGKQDLKRNFEMEFSNTLKKTDSTKIILTDTNYIQVAGTSVAIDSNKLIITAKWTEDTDYRLLLTKGAVTDKIDSSFAKNDTLAIKTKKESDYGNVVLRFTNLDTAIHQVIQFVQNDEVKESFTITGKEWRNKLFTPGEYEIRVLYDVNNNGKWDAGDYMKKLQPEKVIALSKKLSVRENWDNESDINL